LCNYATKISEFSQTAKHWIIYFIPMLCFLSTEKVCGFKALIELENPRAFPRPIVELLKKDVSLPRNPVIAKLFGNVRLADNAGYGFDKMLRWEKATGTEGCFREQH
jgi:hypothetical protein